MRHLAGGKAARALTGTHTTWQLPTSSPVPFSIHGAQGVEPEARLKANLRFAPAQGTGDEVGSYHFVRTAVGTSGFIPSRPTAGPCHRHPRKPAASRPAKKPRCTPHPHALPAPRFPGGL